MKYKLISISFGESMAANTETFGDCTNRSVHEILVHMANESREGSDEGAYLCSLLRAFAAHTHKVRM